MITENYMSLEEFCKLVEYINQNHSWGKGKWVKYIIPSYDTRSKMIYGVKLRGMFDDQEFFVVNQNIHRNLNNWVRQWLDS